MGSDYCTVISYNLYSLLSGSITVRCSASNHFHFTMNQQLKRAVNQIRSDQSEMSESSRLWTLNIHKWEGVGPHFSLCDFHGVLFKGSVEGQSGVQIQVRAKREPKFMFYLSANSTTIQFGLVLQQMPSECLQSPKNDTARSSADGVPAVLSVTRFLY